jgi:hypothetical protein
MPNLENQKFEKKLLEKKQPLVGALLNPQSKLLPQANAQ